MSEAQELALLRMASAPYIPASVAGIVRQIHEKFNSEAVLYLKAVLERDKNSIELTWG